MGKKYQTKKLKKNHQDDAFDNQDSNSPLSPDKEKKITKEPRTKETVLSDIELQIIDMFSRSFTNGEIGVKYPQQKKKGMMRLMNFCFRTIIEEAELYVNPNLKKDSHTAKCVEKRERTIFYLSSNYRYKHIEKSLLEDFKIICKNYVKYHCLEHMDIKFLEKFYKKVIFNDFTVNTTSQLFKATKAAMEAERNQREQENSQQIVEDSEIKNIDLKSPKKQPKVQRVVQTTVAKKPTGAKRGRKRKHPIVEPEVQKEQFYKQDNHLQALSMDEPFLQRDIKANKICIQKVNIYLGYDSKLHGRKQGCDQDLTKIQAHPYARMEVQENENKYIKRKWTNDMESELIDQFMNTSATSPNIIIRNLMKKFGRNKLFVQSQIQAKRKEMFKTSISKFVNAFEGKTLCSEQAVKKMESMLKNMSLSPKNYFIASFIHDFYFKEVQAISVTLLSEYIHKLNRQELIGDKINIESQEKYSDQILNEKKKILERQDLKYALNTMSKLVSNYSYDLAE